MTNQVYVLETRIYIASKLLKLFGIFTQFNMLTSADIQLHQTLKDMEEEFSLNSEDWISNPISYIYQICKKECIHNLSGLIGEYLTTQELPKSLKGKDLPF